MHYFVGEFIRHFPLPRRNKHKLHVTCDELAREFLREASRRGDIYLIAHRRRQRGPRGYTDKYRWFHQQDGVPKDAYGIFVEAEEDPRQQGWVIIRGENRHGYHIFHVVGSGSIPDILAHALIKVRQETGRKTRAYFTWSDCEVSNDFTVRTIRCMQKIVPEKKDQPVIKCCPF